MDMKTDRLGNSTDGKENGDGAVVKSKCSILDLPVEVLIRIFYQLDPIQLNIVRLVCKRWHFAVSDKSTWINSFSGKFHTPKDSFPSVSGSSAWMMEYFARVQIMKKWNKGESLHSTYSLPNSELLYVDRVFADFRSYDEYGKIMTFSQRVANVATSRLQDGRNQGFIDGGNLPSQLILCDLNWNYLVVGRDCGDLAIKNLLTSTTSLSPSTLVFSDPEFEETGNPIISVLINDLIDKHKEKVDIITGHLSGRLTLWTMGGKVVRRISLQEPILNIKSDFKDTIVCNTQTKCYVIEMSNANILHTFDIEHIYFDDETLRDYPVYFGNPSSSRRNILEVDFGGNNIITTYKSRIDVINYKQLTHRHLILEHEVLQAKLQTQQFPKRQRNANLAGKDGLLCAAVLSDNSVIVWGVRDTGDITIQCTIVPEYSKYAPDISRHPHIKPITTIELNSTVIAIGGYNGFVNLYNVFSGDFIREACAKPPKKYQFTEVIPVSKILLNPNERNAAGVIVTGSIVQYFQFGKKTFTSHESAPRKKPKSAGGVKRFDKQTIRDQMDDFDNQRWLEEKRNELFEKYNGLHIEEEDEITVALALSLSVHSPDADDDELQRAIEESKRLQEEHSTTEQHQPDENLTEEEQLRRVLELSLVDQ